MMLDKWTRRGRKAVQEPKRIFSFTFREFCHQFEGNVNYGTNIFDLEWDICIILDACRYDLFLEFASQHEIWETFESVDSVYSIASATSDWVPRTFSNTPASVLRETAYISGNNRSEPAEEYDLHTFSKVWEYSVDDDTGLARRRAVTDRALEVYQNPEIKKMVVHYVVPHLPFLNRIGKYGCDGDPYKIWDKLANGEIAEADFWQDYGENLSIGLSEARLIIENTEGDIIITSDHANGMGEWHTYSHPEGMLHPILRRVPLAKCSGKGNNKYSPKGREEFERDIKLNNDEQLRALGYIE